MSRVGKMPVTVPQGVDVSIKEDQISVKGTGGTLSLAQHALVKVTSEGGKLSFVAADGSREADAMSGTMRQLVNNMVVGVTSGYERVLELVGVGYRAAMKGQALSMQLGFSHDIDIPAPKGITFAVPKQTEVRIAGIDKQAVGEMAARIRKIRPPEPYKGKGVRYAGEQVRRKEGKKK